MVTRITLYEGKGYCPTTYLPVRQVYVDKQLSSIGYRQALHKAQIKIKQESAPHGPQPTAYSPWPFHGPQPITHSPWPAHNHSLAIVYACSKFVHYLSTVGNLSGGIIGYWTLYGNTLDLDRFWTLIGFFQIRDLSIICTSPKIVHHLSNWEDMLLDIPWTWTKFGQTLDFEVLK